MLSKEEFARGIQLINSISINQIEEMSSIDAYYMILQDLEPKLYFEAIVSLIKEKTNMYNPPSPGEILKYYKLEMRKALNSEEMFFLLKKDSVTFGKNKKPPYLPFIEEVITSLGGWESLCLNSFSEEQVTQALLKISSNSNNLLT